MLRITGLMVAAAVLGACGTGWVATGETRRETTSIDLGKAQMARVEIRMGSGELHVTAGTPKLLEAEFAFNVPEWRPLVDYRDGVSGGELTITQPGNAGGSFGKTVYDWTLKLSDRLPLEITTNLGAGEANLELGGMNLQRVEVNMGVGELRLDLRGEPTSNYDVHIQGGVGEATVYLPRDVAISARAAGGIGEIDATGLEKRDGVWMNPDRTNAAVTINLDVKGGVGEIRLIR
jgi:hypothetical protein